MGYGWHRRSSELAVHMYTSQIHNLPAGVEAALVELDRNVPRRFDDHGDVRSRPGYIAGEETAAVRAINGGPVKPTDKPPRPFQQGVAGLPDTGKQR